MSTKTKTEKALKAAGTKSTKKSKFEIAEDALKAAGIKSHNGAVQALANKKTATKDLVPAFADILSGKGEAVANAVANAMGAKLVASKTTKSAATKAPAKETLAAFMRRLITEGKTNDEVFAAAVKQFGIGDEKKSYPSWYRCELARKSKSTK